MSEFIVVVDGSIEMEDALNAFNLQRTKVDLLRQQQKETSPRLGFRKFVFPFHGIDFFATHYSWKPVFIPVNLVVLIPLSCYMTQYASILVSFISLYMQ